MQTEPLIDVCICTFQREQVVDTIASLLSQEPGHPPFRILIADNDETPSAEDRIAAIRRQNIDIVYLHAPSRNISIARNACLSAATAYYVAFLDDDQIAAPGWLKALHDTAIRTGADIVLGPVHAICPPDAPAWARSGAFHSTYPVIRAREITTGYTGNVLMKRSSVGAQRFNLELGRTGGEDTVFFHSLYQQGARIAYAPDATMQEFIPSNRVSLRWLMRRSYRSGQTHGRLIANEGRKPALVLVTSVAKITACLALAAATILSETGWRRALVRGMLHAGVISALLGRTETETYGHATT